VLAIELALLASSSAMSANTSVIHARVLQRRERSIKESLQHDDPNRRSQTDRGKHHQKDTENYSVGDEDATIADTGAEFLA